jgi:hypothetical protein
VRLFVAEEEEMGGGREKVRRGREGFNSNNRVMRRGRIARGQGIKRRPPPPRNKMDYSICKFYMQGKCQRVSIPSLLFHHPRNSNNKSHINKGGIMCSIQQTFLKLKKTKNLQCSKLGILGYT